MFFPTKNKPHVVLNHFLGLSNFPRCCAWLVKAWHWRFPAPSWPMSCDGWSWKNFQRRKAQSSSCTICTRSCCWAKACKNKGFWVKLRRCPAPMILGSERCFFCFFQCVLHVVQKHVESTCECCSKNPRIHWISTLHGSLPASQTSQTTTSRSRIWCWRELHILAVQHLLSFYIICPRPFKVWLSVVGSTIV